MMPAEIQRGGKDSGNKGSNPHAFPQAGGLGAFLQGDMVIGCDEAVFAGDLHKLIGPVKAEFGYNLIEVVNKW
jgi:peptidyl-prolyl cis-trans isomerase C